MLAAMRAGNVTRLSANVNFPINIAVGDSLLHGKGAPGIQGEFDFDGGEMHVYTYRTEDVDDYIKSAQILEVGTYHVVVANPPYITVKDKQENDTYRKAYKSCAGTYALTVPFTERIFQLAIRGAQDGLGAGYTGEIISSSFMKREFGKKLIEEYFPNVDLTHVIDTSGAYLPGHSHTFRSSALRSPKVDDSSGPRHPWRAKSAGRSCSRSCLEGYRQSG
jgi:hypothetical protein